MYPFHPCSTIGVSGCTGSGKTTWVFKFLSQKNDLFFENSPNMVLYCYNVYQAMFENMKKNIENIEFFRGLPGDDKLNAIIKTGNHNIIVLDDLMHEISNDPDMEKLFTQKAHHQNFTVIFITQNLFCKRPNHKNNKFKFTLLCVDAKSERCDANTDLSSTNRTD